MKRLGSVLAYLLLAMVFLSFLTVVLRYLFNVVIIPVQELILYLHAIVFMLGVSYCFAEDRHVSIDVFVQNKSETFKKKTYILGILFLYVPMFGFLLYMSFDYVLASWMKWEGSPETGGLPFVYGLKSFLLIMPAAMLIAALNKLIRSK